MSAITCQEPANAYLLFVMAIELNGFEWTTVAQRARSNSYVEFKSRYPDTLQGRFETIYRERKVLQKLSAYS